jgi:hypothetical protein
MEQILPTESQLFIIPDFWIKLVAGKSPGPTASD